ncbi:MAG TPA: hypothetical protein PLC15_01100 [Candidatus Obscuribacter sp.]|nr:hypothetical protein [Candidatus Obscuribacter sp.]HMW88378.1 hypothetical protein [Candidatus Obscuribacter sp.]HMY02281.1 hypothetical protein [Candidatus Obscuribacter sp.]HNB13941.1 hypothetical protein [Candidatus Obscuribacter sp.]HND04078.1 hypothetical protein [Candidatus Obscuribacter sp.]
MTKKNPPPARVAAKPGGVRLGNLSLVKQLLKEQLARPHNLIDPFAQLPTQASNAAATLQVLQDTVKKGFELLPSRYHSAYVEVLQEALRQSEKSLRSGSLGILPGAKRKKVILEQLKEIFQSLAAPIVQLQGKVAQDQLKAYLALASNLYQRFLQDDTLSRQNSGSEKWPALDPLGFFITNSDGPYTLPPSRELPLSLVAKPAEQVHTVPLWVVDGHEVGGHGIHTVVNGFDSEVAAALKQCVRKSTAKIKNLPERVTKESLALLLLSGDDKNEFAAAELLELLAGSYSQELAADLAGLLNFGPMFTNGLMLYFIAHHKEGTLRNKGRLLPSKEQERMDAHPPDVLRALISIKAVSKLRLDKAQLTTLVADLTARLKEACGGTLPADLVFADEADATAVTLPLKYFEPLIEDIAECLMNEPLKCLGDRPLSQVLTWTQMDQDISERLAQTMMLTSFDHKAETDLEARHLVAASLMALETIAIGAGNQRKDGKRLFERIQANSVHALKDFYLEQCLLCAVPTYSKSRRTETSLKGKTVDSLIKALKRSRLHMKQPGD